MFIDQKQIDDYFSGAWNGGKDKWTITNTANIASKIGPDETVLDIGCGYNPFFEHVKYLYAFDPAIDAGNEMCTLEEFDSQGNTYDVVLCMGSINFGTIEHITSQVEKVVSLVKKGGRIYWRMNPGMADHDNEECKSVPFFEWDMRTNYNFANDNNCDVLDFQIDKHKDDDNKVRLYAEWIKN